MSFRIPIIKPPEKPIEEYIPEDLPDDKEVLSDFYDDESEP
jgi:hypothetical protein